MRTRTRTALIGLAYVAVIAAIDIYAWQAGRSYRPEAFSVDAWLGLGTLVASVTVGYVLANAWCLVLALAFLPDYVLISAVDDGDYAEILDAYTLTRPATFYGALIAIGIFARRTGRARAAGAGAGRGDSPDTRRGSSEAALADGSYDK
jgi:hypothetical protein